MVFEPTISEDIDIVLAECYHTPDQIKEYYDMFEEMLIELSVHEKHEKFRSYFEQLYGALEKALKNEQRLFAKCSEVHNEWLAVSSQLRSCVRMAADEQQRFDQNVRELQYELGLYKATRGPPPQPKINTDSLVIENYGNVLDYIPTIHTKEKEEREMPSGDVEHNERKLATPVGEMTLEIPGTDYATVNSKSAQLHHQITGVAYTEAQLRKQFAALDTNGNGWLSREEVRQLYLSFDNYGLVPERRDLEEMLAKSNALQDGRVTYDEFCIIMLKIAKR